MWSSHLTWVIIATILFILFMELSYSLFTAEWDSGALRATTGGLQKFEAEVILSKSWGKCKDKQWVLEVWEEKRRILRVHNLVENISNKKT